MVFKLFHAFTGGYYPPLIFSLVLNIRILREAFPKINFLKAYVPQK